MMVKEKKRLGHKLAYAKGCNENDDHSHCTPLHTPVLCRTTQQMHFWFNLNELLAGDLEGDLPGFLVKLKNSSCEMFSPYSRR